MTFVNDLMKIFWTPITLYFVKILRDCRVLVWVSITAKTLTCVCILPSYPMVASCVVREREAAVQLCDFVTQDFRVRVSITAKRWYFCAFYHFIPRRRVTSEREAAATRDKNTKQEHKSMERENVMYRYVIRVKCNKIKSTPFLSY